MSKNIVICSDGTGNTAIKGRGTNVFKLFEAVELRANQQDSRLSRQIAFYDDGVGTASFKPLKILGGAIGLGLSRNVRQLYMELARCYEPGDKIFLFGFSRGAYTVRTLVRLIAHVGLVDVRKLTRDDELWRLTGKAYAAHRKCYRRFGKWRKTPVDDGPANAFRRDHAVEDSTPIEFVGVWDTVDAVGFPLDEIADFWHNVVYPFRFPDTDLSDAVKWARHAVALDDERRTFHPELWKETPETKANGRIKQVWFAGVHSNVGGGYPKQGMSLVSLVWMMKEAEARGLRFIPSMRQQYIELQNNNDKLYDSRAGLSGYYGYKPRDMAELCGKRSVTPRVHISALERIALGTYSYAPGNLAPQTEVVTDNTAVGTSSVSAVLAKAFQNKQLLDRGKPWIALWRASQIGFVLASLLVAFLYFLQFGSAGFSHLLSMDGYRRILELLRHHPYVVGILLGVLLLTYGLCYLAARKLHQAYSEFWFSTRKELQSVLWGGTTGKGA